MIHPRPTLPAPPRRSKRWLIVLLAFGFGLGMAVVYRLPLVAGALAPWLAERAGFELEIERILRLDGGVFQLRGLHLRHKLEGGGLRELNADWILLRYDLDLWLGHWGALNELHASGLRIEVSSTAASPAPREPGVGFAWPAQLPLIDLSAVEVVLDAQAPEPRRLRVDSLQLDRAGALELQLQLDGHAIEASAKLQHGLLEGLALAVDDQALCHTTRVDLRRVSLGMLSVQAHLALEAESQEIRVDLADTRIAWQADLHGLDLAQLEARWPLEAGGPLAGRVDLQSNGKLDWTEPLAAAVELSLAASDLQVGGMSFEQLDFDALLIDEELRIPSLVLRQSARNRGSLERAVLPLKDLDTHEWLSAASARISLELTDLGGLLARWQAAPGAPLEFVEHRLALRCELDDSILTVTECGLQSAAGDLVLSQAGLDFRQPEHIKVRARGHTSLDDLSAIGTLLGREGWVGALQGELELEGEWPLVSGHLELAGDSLLLEDYPLGHLELSLNSPALGRELEVTNLKLETPEGSLQARLRCDFGESVQLVVEEFDLQREGHDLRLQSEVRIEYDSQAWRVEPLVLEGTGGRVHLQGHVDQDSLDVQLLVDRLEVVGLVPQKLRSMFSVGDVQFDLQISGNDGNLRFTSAGSTNALHPTDWPGPIDLRWIVNYQAGRLWLASLEIDGGEGLRLDLSGVLPLAIAGGLELSEGDLEIDLDARLPVALWQAGGAGTLRTKGSLAGTWKAVSGQFDVSGEQLRLASPLYPEKLGSTDLHGTLTLADGVRIEDLSIHLGEWIDAQLDARIHTSLDATHWLADSAGVLQASTLDGQLKLPQLDLAQLRPLLVSLTEMAVVLMEGQVAAQLNFEGPLQAPVLSGELQLEGGRLRPGGGLPPVEALSMELQLQDQLIELQRASGTLGAAPFEVSGRLDLAGDQPQVQLQLRGDDLLLVRDAKARVRADADLQLSGGLDELLVEGSLLLTSGFYSPDVRFLNLRPGPRASGARGFQLFALRDAPLRDMRFDIELGAHKPFEVRNTILKGGMRPELRLVGTGLVPQLHGTVYLEPTRLYLPATQMTLSAGTVRFLEENPFVPELDLVGEGRMLGHEIRAEITGAYDEPELMLHSTPPLSQEDLFLLVLTGRLPEDPNRNDVLSTANTVAIYLARDTLARLVSDDGPLDEDAVLERLEFSHGEEVSKNGTETFDVVFRLTTRKGKSPERKDARHVYLGTQRDKFEDYNFGLRWVFRFKR